jgi:hypothetical protein
LGATASAAFNVSEESGTGAVCFGLEDKHPTDRARQAAKRHAKTIQDRLFIILLLIIFFL